MLHVKLLILFRVVLLSQNSLKCLIRILKLNQEEEREEQKEGVTNFSVLMKLSVGPGGLIGHILPVHGNLQFCKNKSQKRVMFIKKMNAFF